MAENRTQQKIRGDKHNVSTDQIKKSQHCSYEQNEEKNENNNVCTCTYTLGRKAMVIFM